MWMHDSFSVVDVKNIAPHVSYHNGQFYRLSIPLFELTMLLVSSRSNDRLRLTAVPKRLDA